MLTPTPAPSKWYQVPPAVKTGLVVCAAVIAVAGPVHLIWGKIGLACYGSIVFGSFIYRGPVIRIWRHVELKGVLLAVATAAFPFFPYGGLLSSGYLAICIATYQFREMKTGAAVDEIKATVERQNVRFQTLAETFDADLQTIDRQLFTAAKGSVELEAAYKKIVQEHADRSDVEAKLKAIVDRIKKRIDDVAKLQEEIRANPEQIQLQLAIQKWTAAAIVKEEEIDKLIAEREKIEQVRKELEEVTTGLQQDVVTRKRATAEFFSAT